MADLKISQLTAAASAAGSNEIPINEAGTTKKLTVTQIQSGLEVSANKSTDTALGTSDTLYPSQNAVKSYVDAIAQGLSVKGSVILATAEALPTNTYLAGLITITATGTLTVDGVVTSLNDRILVKDESAQLKNGVYKVTTAGAIGVAAVLTRSTDMDIAAEFPGAFVFVESGTVNTAAGFVCTNSTPPTVGTTAITFTQFSGAGEITAGAALTKTANTLDVAVDGVGIEVNADALRLKDAGVTLAKLANLAQNLIIGRVTGSTGVPEALTAANVRTIINVADGATANAKATKSEMAAGTDDTKFLTALAAAELHLLPEGGILNGKIVVTDAAGITIALKGKDGNDPSATNPVYAMIGGTLRSITAALSVAKDDGTNWCNLGSAELATKENDLFIYLGYNATDGVVVGFSRIPWAYSYDDFSTTTTNEKYCAISTITTAAATDYYNVIGRFAATLSAGAGYTWTVPTFTAKNLIQRPIWETRKLDYVPAFAGSGSMTITGTPTISSCKYSIRGRDITIETRFLIETAGTVSNIFTFTVPFTHPNAYPLHAMSCRGSIGGNFTTATINAVLNTNTVECRTFNGGNWTIGVNQGIDVGNFVFSI